MTDTSGQKDSRRARSVAILCIVGWGGVIAVGLMIPPSRAEILAQSSEPAALIKRLYVAESGALVFETERCEGESAIWGEVARSWQMVAEAHGGRRGCQIVHYSLKKRGFPFAWIEVGERSELHSVCLPCGQPRAFWPIIVTSIRVLSLIVDIVFWAVPATILATVAWLMLSGATDVPGHDAAVGDQ